METLDLSTNMNAKLLKILKKIRIQQEFDPGPSDYYSQMLIPLSHWISLAEECRMDVNILRIELKPRQ